MQVAIDLRSRALSGGPGSVQKQNHHRGLMSEPTDGRHWSTYRGPTPWHLPTAAVGSTWQAGASVLPSEAPPFANQQDVRRPHAIGFRGPKSKRSQSTAR